VEEECLSQFGNVNLLIEDDFQDLSFCRNRGVPGRTAEARFRIHDNYWEDILDRQLRIDNARRTLNADVTPLLADNQIEQLHQGGQISSLDYVCCPLTSSNKPCHLQLFLDLQCQRSKSAYEMLLSVLQQEFHIGAFRQRYD
jgi:hypothetical protein